MAIWNERIRNKRLQKGITLAQIADKLGVTEATAQRYESGSIKSIPYEHMCAYGEILGCSPAYLMGWNDESIETKYNTLSSYDSENLNRYAEYLYLRERQLITDSNSSQYIDFITAEKVQQMSDVGKRKVFSYATNLLDLEIADEELDAARARTDIDATEEMNRHDDDIMNDDSEWE